MTHYIDKDALVAEINRQHKILMQTDHTYGAQFVLGFRQACRQIIDFLNTFKVKEVDLEKEVELWIKSNVDDAGYFNTLDFAKYFFELRFKTQKGE